MSRKVKITPDKKLKEKHITKEVRYLPYILVILLPLITLYYYYNFALETNGFFCFPIDDTWIHLTFAKNLNEYFSFSYFQNESVTAGSTSPIFVFLLAAGFFFTSNEMLLGVAFSGLFFVISSFFFYKLALISFNDGIILSLICTLVLIFDYLLNFISLSGMETSMFIFALILSAFFYKQLKVIPLGIMLGILIWIRPDGAAFVAAIGADYLYNRFLIKNPVERSYFSVKQVIIILSIFTFLVSLYAFFNYMLSGTVLPNTYSAKISQFINSETRFYFLEHVLWDQFTFKYYSILMAGFILSVLKFFWDLFNRNQNKNSLYILFIFLFLLMYLIKLPTISKFSRYQIPIIPFFILVSLLGFKDMFELTKTFFKQNIISKFLTYATFVLLLCLSIYYYFILKDFYAEECSFINKRQVAVANWFKANTNENDIISTHDVGAIGFYSGRKIVDIAGLVTPELISKINDPDYLKFIPEYMSKAGVTYTAYFREFYNVKNQNPLFIAPPANEKEVFLIYKFIPHKSELISFQANRILYTTIYQIGNLSGSQIIENMNKVLELEPDCAFAYYTKAIAYKMLNDDENTEKSFKKAISLQPDYTFALLDYSDFLSIKQNKPEEGREYLLKVLETEPANQMALQKLKLIDAYLKK